MCRAEKRVFGVAQPSHVLKQRIGREYLGDMPTAKHKRDRDGIQWRKDRRAYYGSWTDASGMRRKRRLNASTLTQARTLLAAEKFRVEKSRTLGYVPPGKETLEDVTTRYLKHQKVRLTPHAYERTRGIVEGHLKQAFGKTRLADIRRVNIQHYITTRCSEVSPGSVVKELNVLKHLLGLAVEWEVIPTNPCRGVKPPRVPAGRLRYLQPTELKAVLATCPQWLWPIVALLVATGMRRSEVLGLRWLDVDRKGNRLLLPQTKNGEGRIVYLNRLARESLDSLPPGQPTDLVFSGDSVTPENVSLTFLRACRRVGIVDFRLHDLRHTAASWLRMKGADIHTVAQLLGHKDLRMAARYQHLSPAFLAEAVARLDTAYELPAAKARPQAESRRNMLTRSGDLQKQSLELSEPMQNMNELA
jgi:integrase